MSECKCLNCKENMSLQNSDYINFILSKNIYKIFCKKCFKYLSDFNICDIDYIHDNECIFCKEYVLFDIGYIKYKEFKPSKRIYMCKKCLELCEILISIDKNDNSF